MLNKRKSPLAFEGSKNRKPAVDEGVSRRVDCKTLPNGVGSTFGRQFKLGHCVPIHGIEPSLYQSFPAYQIPTLAIECLESVAVTLVNH